MSQLHLTSSIPHSASHSLSISREKSTTCSNLISRDSSSATGSIKNGEVASIPSAPIAIMAAVIFFALSIFLLLMALYFRHTSLCYRLAKDGFICDLLSPLTGLKLFEHIISSISYHQQKNTLDASSFCNSLPSYLEACR